MWRYILLMMLLLWPLSSSAIYPYFNPFTPDEERARASTHAKHSSSSNVKAGIEPHPKDPDLRILRILVGGKSSYIKDPNSFWFGYHDPIVADLDGNGLDDVVKFYYPGSQGYGFRCSLIIFSQFSSGKFVEFTLPAEAFEINDIFDSDGDGIYKIVTSCLTKFQGHNYWVYRCWHLNGNELLNVDDRYAFPRAIWFTMRPYLTRTTTHNVESPDKVHKILKNYPNSKLAGNIKF